MKGTPQCQQKCGCTSDVECPHYDCGNLLCEACFPPLESTTAQEDARAVSPIAVVLLAPCPRCGEWSNYPCRDKHDRLAGDPHAERWGVVQALGLLTLSPLPDYLSETTLEGALS